MGKKNIVLLHGWGASWLKLVPLAEKLEKLGWSVRTLKLPGFDLKDPEKPWTLDDYAANVIKNASGLKNYYLFGHSFGGRITIKIASKHPSNLNGMVLCAAGGISRASILKRAPFYVAAKVGKPLVVHAPIAKKYKSLLYKLAREHDYEKTSGVMRATFKNILSEDLRPLLESLKTPTLIIWGDMDKTTPLADGKYLASKISNSKLVIQKGMGHTIAYEATDALANEIDKWVDSIK